MSFQDRYEKHETAIQKRWQPFSIEVLEQNVLEGTSEIISILEKAKQSAKEIHDQEEKLTYLEFIEDKLLWNQACSFRYAPTACMNTNTNFKGGTMNGGQVTF